VRGPAGVAEPKGDAWMGAKQLTYRDEARQKLMAGVSKLARAVRSTLGPRGRNAVIDKGWGSPTVTKDGVTVAEEIELQDPYENMGAQLVKEAASKTSDVAGDGTTTATILAEAMKLGGASNGVITVEEGKTAETEVVVVQGMQFDRGYLSPHFVTNQDQMICELDNPYILIYEEKIGSAKNLIPLLETISKKKESLLIIAEDLEGDALPTLVLNKLKGILQVCADKAPGYGDRRRAILAGI